VWFERGGGLGHLYQEKKSRVRSVARGKRGSYLEAPIADKTQGGERAILPIWKEQLRAEHYRRLRKKEALYGAGGLQSRGRRKKKDVLTIIFL